MCFCILARAVSDRLWINGRYDIDAFAFLDGTPVPTEVMSLRDPTDNGRGCMSWYSNMLWRDTVCTNALVGLICQKDIAGNA